MGKIFIKVKNAFFKRFTTLNYSKYVKDYLFRSNTVSSIYVSIVVAALEIWMIITVFTGTIFSDGTRTFWWLIQHTALYIVLLMTAIIMFIYSVSFLKGKIQNQLVGNGIRVFFTVVAITFGLYISYISYDKSGQVFAFITMEVFCLCLLVWHPVTHFLILTVSFGIYLYLQSRLAPLTYSIVVNSFTLWIALLMAGINIHHQRRLEAQKDENLEKLTVYLKNKSQIDELTGLPNFEYFQKEAVEKLNDESIEVSLMRFVFMDIENFKNYNEKYGFTRGNDFLRTVGQIVARTFEGDITAHFSDDHFIVLAKSDRLEEKLEYIKQQIAGFETTIQLGLKSGIYIPFKRSVAPSVALDRARYACYSIKKHFSHDIAEYNAVMDSEFKKKKYIINNIDSAIKEGYIHVYYQPVIWAETGKLCGAEALARWHDPTFGLISPAAFIPVLEEYHQIHKLDMFVMESVCSHIKDAYDGQHPRIPVSINFSRLDFELSDPVKEVSACIEKYGISKNDIHVEITESALSDSDMKLKEAMDNFRAQGYSLWLDDFGSGYSGLNVLKDFSFDMMKIDMKFLSKFSENKKTQPILSSIVSLAKNIGMQTLTEGVETEEAYEFLRSIGCQRLQGYLFGRPMPKDEFLEKILSGKYQVQEMSSNAL
ncbi:MAG: EAL domain-containing protein [Treponema sp.]|nr:EAL domain-containing protein [Treponema sp.]